MNTHRDNESVPTDDLGELLKSRVDAMRQQPVRMRSMVCGECGSPLSETSQFCWMCGATRDASGVTKAPEMRHAEVPGPQLVAPFPAIQSPAAKSTADFPPAETAAPEPTEAPSVAEQKPVYDLPPAAEPELFAHIYGRDKEPNAAKEEDEDEEKSRRFDYRLVAVPLLVLLIVFLSYQQRRSAKDFFAMVRELVEQQIAQLWPADKESKPPTRRVTEPAKPVNARKRPPASSGQVHIAEAVRAAKSTPVPLRVRVEGQPGPLVSPALARFMSPVPFQRSISVGITGAAFSAPVPPSPMRVQIAPTESLSLLLKQVPPVYPEAAREAKIEGSVVLNVVIRKDGNVGELSVVSGNPMLVQAAIDAVKQWVYRPYYRGGQPMDVETLVVVEFSLVTERAAVGGGF